MENMNMDTQNGANYRIERVTYDYNSGEELYFPIGYSKTLEGAVDIVNNSLLTSEEVPIEIEDLEKYSVIVDNSYVYQADTFRGDTVIFYNIYEHITSEESNG